MSRKSKSNIFIYLITLIFSLIIISGCASNWKNAKMIKLEDSQRTKKDNNPLHNKPIRIAMGRALTPIVAFTYYSDFLKYIEEKLKMPVEFIDREEYAEIIKLFVLGNIDVAFVCGKPYVDAHDNFGLELLVAPQAYGETVYYSYIIVHKDSNIKNFEELKGKSFAFADPLSNSGKLYPTYVLYKMGETPDSFFSRYYFTYKHDKSIQAVADKSVDGAAVDSLIWEHYNHMKPEFTSKTKIIKKSPPFGIPPVVVRPNLDPKLKRRIKEIFLNANIDTEGRKILSGMCIDKFVEIDDSAYQSIRDMEKWITKQKR